MEDFRALEESKQVDKSAGYHIVIRGVYPPVRVYTNNLVKYMQELDEKRPVWVIPSEALNQARLYGHGASIHEMVETDDPLYFSQPQRLIDWFTLDEFLTTVAARTVWTPDENFLDYRLDLITSMCKECEREAEVIKEIIRGWWNITPAATGRAIVIPRVSDKIREQE